MLHTNSTKGASSQHCRNWVSSAIEHLDHAERTGVLEATTLSSGVHVHVLYHLSLSLPD